ncbi:diacylglycerol kinase [Thiothrix lacustris]|jgi:diacylglycerol kinase (ATP)|uniref:Diacylglycerol kinase n=1 Tax=Thiothrix lacustris TaxID=525917 RepID=A0ABY9MP83_9GAMM|nr:diacylglycerol kinase [Thiothrix lacustris]WML90051.1 diacylglycerol kinase [Thiothrix lacustris]WMP18351.1 diacylglycerol kinase [Thiothrix lacustris]
MADSGNTGLTRIMKAGQYSWQGFQAAYQHEEAFRQEVWLLLVAVPLALWFGDNGIDRALMIGSLLLLLIVELLNSAIEAVVDRTGMEKHKLAGRAKDMGSAAVTVAILNVILIWLFILC